MSAQVTISQLPTASALTGQELVPIVQSGVTVQTTTGAISGAGALNYPFLTVGTTAGLTQARYLSTSAGLSLSDTGAGGQLTINMTGPASSLNAAGTGIVVKNGASTVTSVQLAVGAGMTIANADGVAGNPTLGLSAILQNISSTSAPGLLTINGTTIISSTITGTTNQISIANGNGVSGSPTVSIYPNPVLPGTGSVVVPSGTTAQRSGTNGALRYNTDIASLEAYTNSAWGAIVSGSGVTTFSAGTTGFTPNTPTSGGIVLGGIVNPATGGTGVNNGTNTITVAGNFATAGAYALTLTATGATNVTVPTTGTLATLGGVETLTNKSMSGSSNTFTNIPNSALTNSSVTYNGVTVALGASGTITAVNPYTLTFGTHLTGTSYNGSAAVTIGTDATNANTVSTIVARDASGNFSAGTITATLNGTATQVSNALTFGSSLSGTSSTYNGSAAVTVNVANSGVTAGTYGSSAVIPVITVGADGRVTSVSTQATNAPAYQGTWNASTNTPTLTSSVGTAGYYYVVTVAGNTTLNGVSGWNVGDWAIFSNGAWQKIPGSTTESFTNLITTNLQIGGLTGFVYANNTTGYATAATTAQLLSLLGTTPVANGGTGLTTLAAGALTYGAGTSAHVPLAIGTAGQVLTVNSGGTAPQWTTLSGVSVTTFSGGTTGFTPSTATTGAVTLAGTLATTNGGTGLTSFTANGVVYASSTSALATGTALTFDGTNFATTGAISTSNNLTFTGTGNRITGDLSNATVTNKVFFQTTTANSPTTLSIAPSGTSTTSFYDAWASSSGFVNASYARFGTDGTQTLIQSQIVGTGTYLPMTFYTGGSERVRIDTSGNVGIGTSSPSYKLDVQGTLGAGSTITTGTGVSTGSVNIELGGARTGDGVSFIDFHAVASTDYEARIIRNASANGTFQFINSGTGELSIQQAGAAPITFQTSATERMRIDSSGNVGIGTSSPSARLNILSAGSWSSSNWGKGFYVNTSGSACNPAIGISDANGSNNWAIVNLAGALTFNTGPAITDSTTAGIERMRIDASGNLLVGTTNSEGPSRISSVSTTTGTACVSYRNTAGAGSNFAYFLNSGNSAIIGSISNNGNTGTLYNVTSDYRLKTVIGPVADAGQRIDALQPVEYTWKSNGSQTRGFLAHQFQEVYATSVTGTKDAVDADGNPVYQAMQASTSEVIADLVAEIQSLRKRLTALENK